MKLQRAGSLVDVYKRGRVDGNANEKQEEGLIKYRRHRQWKDKRLGRCRRIVADRGEVAQLGRNAMTSPAGNNVETTLLFLFYILGFHRRCAMHRKSKILFCDCLNRNDMNSTTEDKTIAM